MLIPIIIEENLKNKNEIIKISTRTNPEVAAVEAVTAAAFIAVSVAVSVLGIFEGRAVRTLKDVGMPGAADTCKWASWGAPVKVWGISAAWSNWVPAGTANAARGRAKAAPAGCNGMAETGCSPPKGSIVATPGERSEVRARSGVDANCNVGAANPLPATREADRRSGYGLALHAQQTMFTTPLYKGVLLCFVLWIKNGENSQFITLNNATSSQLKL